MVLPVGAAKNKDGLTVRFEGTYQQGNQPYWNRLRFLAADGYKKYYVMDIDLETVGASTTFFPCDNNNDGTRDGFDTGEMYLLSGSSIRVADGYCLEAGAGGTDFTVGTYQVDGTAIDADGIIAATEGAIANFGAVGELIIGNGALVADTTGIVGLTADSWVAVTTNGTFTAGKVRLILEVVTPASA